MTQKPNIVLTGHIDVPQDRIEAVRAALPAHIALTRAEPGCLSFLVVEDRCHPGRFNVSERFTHRSAFDAHQARTKASDWATITAGIPRHYTVTEVDA
ncbi:Quinol monooxygenase YgiN [Aliiroseovarius halocynthiae]|uniref:Antibiotic biosynthesis monooxygenase n=1 Tax=Aliiroseovarius halocynthiae TaxID=985055 RepID=A0A545SVX6_9RHOB|nr:putative quinol monooxygenase [Aliiroseovarius halocynthiae]TQV69115.1 antibiotic biosynthesis monooxygenase [Aliiroseovarius halocynthiae]SMR71872.1 Quinol monooxygenase YgiN [Aliiroseovarius halocynthiae]